MKKSFYHFIRIILGFYNRFYFTNFTVVGRENIPQDGVVIFSPNHQNAFMDPLLVGTTCQKSVYSLTRSDVFGGPLQWFLDAMQTLPIYRIRDGYGQLKKNEAVFERCFALLKEKKHLMMFSEGRHHPEYYLLELSRGSSRLGLLAQLRTPENPVYIQAVGLNYGNHNQGRHRCVVVYGKALDLRPYLSLYKQSAAKGINTLRNDLQKAMEDCLWLPQMDTTYQEKKPLINWENTKLPFEDLKTRLAQQSNTLVPANKDKTIIEQLLIYVLIFPNLPVHLTLYFVRKQFKDPVFHGSVNYLGGLVLFVVWWILIIGVATTTMGFDYGIGFFIASIFSLYLRQFLIVRNL